MQHMVGGGGTRDTESRFSLMKSELSHTLYSGVKESVIQNITDRWDDCFWRFGCFRLHKASCNEKRVVKKRKEGGT